MFGTLETVFETLDGCLPGVGLTEIDSFPVSPSLDSAFDFVGESGQHWSVWDPRGLRSCPALCSSYTKPRGKEQEER